MTGDPGALPPPPRPSLPPLFTCSVLFWVLCAASFATGMSRTARVNAWAAALCAVAVVGMLAASSRPRLRVPMLVSAGLVAGLALGCAQSAQQLSCAEHAEATAGEANGTLTLLEDSRSGIYGQVAYATFEPEGEPPFTCIATFDSPDARLVGETLEVRGRLSPVDYERNARAWQRGACASLRIASAGEPSGNGVMAALRAARRHAVAALEGEAPHSAVLQAIVCGYRANIQDTQLYSQYQACGLAHLVAVSGAHLVMVTGLIACLLRRAKVPRPPSVCILIASMAGYYVIAGMPVSALRACVMTSLGLAAFFGRRRASSLNAVGAGVFGIVAADPTASVSASFALSTLSTLGIVLFAPRLAAWLRRLFAGRASFVADALALTGAAAITSQGYAASLFGQVPLVSPLANVACAPLFPLVCGTGLAASALSAVAPAPNPATLAAGAFCAILDTIVQALAGIPYASVPFSLDPVFALAASAVAATALWAAWPMANARTTACVLVAGSLIAVIPYCLPRNADEIVMLDVGQGDSFLVRSHGSTLLIDTGNQDTRLLKELGVNHVAHLDSVLVTHSDDDHCGSLDALQKAVDVDRVLVAADMLNCDAEPARDLVSRASIAAAETVGLRAGDRFDVGAFSFEVLWPREFHDDGGNADSLCLLARYDGDGDGVVDCTALFTGDAEWQQVAELLESGSLGHVDVLKVGHHGSRNGMTEEQAAAVRPEVALISCGKGNRYGHPAPETLNILAATGASIYRTDQDGEVRCTLSTEKLTVSCEA